MQIIGMLPYTLKQRYAKHVQIVIHIVVEIVLLQAVEIVTHSIQVIATQMRQETAMLGREYFVALATPQELVVEFRVLVDLLQETV